MANVRFTPGEFRRLPVFQSGGAAEKEIGTNQPFLYAELANQKKGKLEHGEQVYFCIMSESGGTELHDGTIYREEKVKY